MRCFFTGRKYLMNYEILEWENTNLTYRSVLWNLRKKVLFITCCKQVTREIATPSLVVFAMTYKYALE